MCGGQDLNLQFECPPGSALLLTHDKAAPAIRSRTSCYYEQDYSGSRLRSRLPISPPPHIKRLSQLSTKTPNHSLNRTLAGSFCFHHCSLCGQSRLAQKLGRRHILCNPHWDAGFAAPLLGLLSCAVSCCTNPLGCPPLLIARFNNPQPPQRPNSAVNRNANGGYAVALRVILCGRCHPVTFLLERTNIIAPTNLGFKQVLLRCQRIARRVRPAVARAKRAAALVLASGDCALRPLVHGLAAKHKAIFRSLAVFVEFCAVRH